LKNFTGGLVQYQSKIFCIKYHIKFYFEKSCWHRSFSDVFYFSKIKHCTL